MNRPAIWDKLDKLINNQPYHKFYVISDKDYQALYDALLPAMKAELGAFGSPIFSFEGKDYNCMAYKQFPFISESEYKKNE